MRALSGILGLVLVVAVIYFVYSSQFGGNKAGEAPPKQQIDVAAVRSDLLSLAQAEKLYCASNGTYATLEQLQQQGAVQFGGTGRRGYTFTIETNAALGFRITARPADPARTDWPTLSIDENMQITTAEAQEPR